MEPSTTASGPSLARWVHPGMATRLGASAFVRDRGDALMCHGAFVGNQPLLLTPPNPQPRP